MHPKYVAQLLRDVQVHGNKQRPSQCLLTVPGKALTHPFQQCVSACLSACPCDGESGTDQDADEQMTGIQQEDTNLWAHMICSCAAAVVARTAVAALDRNKIMLQALHCYVLHNL